MHGLIVLITSLHRCIKRSWRVIVKTWLIPLFGMAEIWVKIQVGMVFESCLDYMLWETTLKKEKRVNRCMNLSWSWSWEFKNVSECMNLRSLIGACMWSIGFLISKGQKVYSHPRFSASLNFHVLSFKNLNIYLSIKFCS